MLEQDTSGTAAADPKAVPRPRTVPVIPTGVTVTPALPGHRRLLVAAGVIAGFLLTVAWSAPFVDQTIGGEVSGALLGDGTKTPAAGILAGLLFAVVSGLAGSFTACNIAAFSAVGPLIGEGSGRSRLRAALVPLGQLAAGMLAVAALYGALVGVVGTRMPQFATTPFKPGSVSPLLAQAMIVFGVIGVAMLYLSLSTLGLVPDPFARVSRRFPGARTVFMGVLIGGFLVGRPYPLFRAMFADAANRHDPLFGAFAFALQSAGNIIVLSVLFLLLTLVLGGPFGRWLAARPQRATAITAVGLAVAGAFLVLYWDVRLLAVVKVIGWYPLAPWV